MAELLTPFVALNRQLLRGGPDESGGLKLMQQFFRRTDVSPPPHHGCHDPWVEPRSWHMVRRLLFALRHPMRTRARLLCNLLRAVALQDQGFLPCHYDGPISSDKPPRQMFYHS